MLLQYRCFAFGREILRRLALRVIFREEVLAYARAYKMVKAELNGVISYVGSSNERQAFYARKLRAELRQASLMFDKQATAATAIQVLPARLRL